MAALMPFFLLVPVYVIYTFYRYGGGSSAPRVPVNSKYTQREPSQPTAHKGMGANGDFDGVILWPEEEPHTILVPPMPAIKSDAFASDSEPLSIPFWGVYWMFRFPFTAPPSNSFVTRGNPDKLTFRSSDGRPLLMEAHQNIGKHIKTNCCRGIQIAVANADQFPDSVSVELVLIDSALPDKPRESLGKAAITSSPRWSPGDNGESYGELLTFTVPSSLKLREFDEFEVRFHLGQIRATRSARISISRFILLPRGG